MDNEQECALIEENRLLTKLVAALHYRLTGGTVARIPNEEFDRFDGTELISVDQKEGDRFRVIKVSKAKKGNGDAT
ncbi:MAG TPA: hypothetical protein ENH82_19830 [bacterium]|nr:hypothetical protein [bacterium]